MKFRFKNRWRPEGLPATISCIVVFVFKSAKTTGGAFVGQEPLNYPSQPLVHILQILIFVVAKPAVKLLAGLGLDVFVDVGGNGDKAKAEHTQVVGVADDGGEVGDEVDGGEEVTEHANDNALGPGGGLLAAVGVVEQQRRVHNLNARLARVVAELGPELFVGKKGAVFFQSFFHVPYLVV